MARAPALHAGSHRFKSCTAQCFRLKGLCSRSIISKNSNSDAVRSGEIDTCRISRAVVKTLFLFHCKFLFEHFCRFFAGFFCSDFQGNTRYSKARSAACTYRKQEPYVMDIFGFSEDWNRPVRPARQQVVKSWPGFPRLFRKSETVNFFIKHFLDSRTG